MAHHSMNNNSKFILYLDNSTNINQPPQQFEVQCICNVHVEHIENNKIRFFAKLTNGQTMWIEDISKCQRAVIAYFEHKYKDRLLTDNQKVPTKTHRTSRSNKKRA